jgi:hypothetical protein
MKIKGNNKPNELIGTDEDDKIFGMDGNDTIIAQGGHDDVDGGDGDDKITISANTSATVDAGKGDDKVKLSAAALASEINLGKGNDTVDVKDSNQSNQAFVIAGGKGDDAVNFVLDQDQYADVTENGDGAFTITDVNGNTYTITSIETLTFNGALYQEPGNPVNTAPVVANPIGDQVADQDDPFTFQFASNVFSDAENDTLTFSATLADGSALPGWLSFDAATRTFSGTPDAGDVGTISVRVMASDGALSVTDDFSITITDDSNPNPVVISGVLYLTNSFEYDVSESGGIITIQFGTSAVSFQSADVQSVVTQGSNSVDINSQGWLVRGIQGNVNYTNVTFSPAGPGTPDVKFESTFELGPDAIPVNGTATVNGSAADYFRAAWDYLDDHYSYYNEPINSFGIDLGIKYAQYLAAGGTPLTDIVKYTSDGGDAGTTADRQQTLHDNLLGNLNENAISDKFGNLGTPSTYTPAEIYQRIIDAGLGDYLGVIGNINDGRGYYGGDESELGTAGHTQVRVFDYAHGVDRSDYNFFDDNGSVDAQAINSATGNMYFGSGNSPANYVISQHEGAGIETALKVHVRGGADYMPTTTTAGNVVHFTVDDGPGSTASWGTPAYWNFDYSIVTGLNGSSFDMDDFDFEIKVDMDSGAGVNYQVFDLQHLGAGNTPFTSANGAFGDDDGTNANISQNSVNLGFSFLKNNIDGGTYNYGAGTFDIELLAYVAGTNNVHIQVHVM